MQQRQPSGPARFGSQVITGDDTGNDRAEQPDAGPSGVLRLRGAPPRDAPRVQWGNDVVDNENMGKKKSKICCIYHKPKAFDESSSDDSSSDASDADSSGDDKDKDESNHGDAGQEAQGEHSSQQPSACGHHHHHRKSKGKHKHKQKGSSSGSVVEIDKGKRNAYEVQPGSKD